MIPNPLVLKPALIFLRRRGRLMRIVSGSPAPAFFSPLDGRQPSGLHATLFNESHRLGAVDLGPKAAWPTRRKLLQL